MTSPDARAMTRTTTTTRPDGCAPMPFERFENEISAPALGWTEGPRRVNANAVDALER